MSLSLLIVPLLLQSPVSAKAGTLECPASIPQDSIKLTSTPQSWTTFVGAPLYLHAAAPLSGPPEQLGELADFTQKRGKGTWTNTYQLDGKFPEGKWLACSYGESGQLTLAKRLDDSIQVCIFTYRKGAHVGQNDIAITCR